MSATNQDGAVENIRGAIEIMLAKPSGLSRMDLSAAGFAISFAALLIAGLIDASAYSIRYGSIDAQLAAEGLPVEWSALGYILSSLIIGLASYGVSVLIIMLIANEDERRRVPTMVTVNNWAAPVVSLVVLPLILAEAVLPSLQVAINLTFIGLLICILVAGWQIMTISMEAAPGRGAWLFAVSLVTSVIVNATLERWVGLATFAPPPA
ncbi:hypothetical protein [Ahrensia sp. R2A130]|uniref:hypothetical protein n=1 Tax=Ahrensia sp. R2A130 TaxID=744979 RepID=UPI0001E0E881|nr:hypothetical protein [Ahrensia sp. R2A130]EFL89857.1 hypothetical protein R2A130_2469 [Ahrensia sp. R2A130]